MRLENWAHTANSNITNQIITELAEIYWGVPRDDKPQYIRKTGISTASYKAVGQRVKTG